MILDDKYVWVRPHTRSVFLGGTHDVHPGGIAIWSEERQGWVQQWIVMGYLRDRPRKREH